MFNTRRKNRMHRLKRWINEAVSSYEEQLKENPIETIAISLSWVFVIIIGLMAVFAYIKFIIDGGYSLSVARIKENGALPALILQLEQYI